ncbi:hypothetical protein Hypma_001588 [Hypsizygus marmoreus]|uniref:Protein kinase domain-containing protein n=1 Tax=Hypsizygus marmoreus TaxID=39966 RepID=A0A369J6A6_HYPMA|nr:hypothetical protein Hypma_001588 [Hypsizygus marmoreus]
MCETVPRVLRLGWYRASGTISYHRRKFRRYLQGKFQGETVCPSAPPLETPATYAAYEPRSAHMELHHARNARPASEGLSFQHGRYLTENTRKFVARLSAVLQDVTQYKQLLRCRGFRAQQLLDIFQTLLNTPHLDAPFRGDLVVAMQRLSILGQYPITGGSFADIYKGKFQGETVCLKVMRLYQTSDIDSFLKRFSAEAILWGQLSHPNLLPSYGIYRYISRPCLVSPWMENGNISAFLLHKPDVDRILLIADISAGVNYLHDNNVIHGDLKGENILVNSSGRACLADFGLSGVSDSKILHWTSQSRVASKGGSIRWQAPELFGIETDEVVFNTKASDVFAWSGVCYEIFTGNVPFFEEDNDSRVTLKVTTGVRPSRPPDSSLAWSSWGLSESVWSLMQVCWSEDSTERPTIAEIIAKHASEVPVDTRPVDRGNTIFPARFRDFMGGREVLSSIADLEAILICKGGIISKL